MKENQNVCPCCGQPMDLGTLKHKAQESAFVISGFGNEIYQRVNSLNVDDLYFCQFLLKRISELTSELRNELRMLTKAALAEKGGAR